MEIKWTPREKRASAIIGGISSVFLAVAIFGPSINNPSIFFLNLAIALNGFALAISPHVLFEPVSIKGFKLRSPMLVGGAALLGLCGNTCLLLFLWYWFVGRML